VGDAGEDAVAAWKNEEEKIDSLNQNQNKLNLIKKESYLRKKWKK